MALADISRFPLARIGLLHTNWCCLAKTSKIPLQDITHLINTATLPTDREVRTPEHGRMAKPRRYAKL